MNEDELNPLLCLVIVLKLSVNVFVGFYLLCLSCTFVFVCILFIVLYNKMFYCEKVDFRQ